MTISIPQSLEEEPPSAKLVYVVLEDHGSCLSREVVEATTLPERTVRDALSRLEERGAVESRPAVVDARAHQYELTSVE